MEYIYYSTLDQVNPFSTAHINVIDKFIDDFKKRSVVKAENCVTGSKILNLELTEIPNDDLKDMHFHYSSKNNGASIEKNGLESTIGENSEDVDTKQAIYFSVGLEAVLHNWDVWLKWRLNRFNNPHASGVRHSTELCRNYNPEIWQLCVKWMKHMSSKAYRTNKELLRRAFEFEKTELERSDYYILMIQPGVDYPEAQCDPKKCFIEGSEYAEEIYGVGVSTDLSNNYAEQWNRSTELGEKASIAPERMFRATAFGKDDALSVLTFLWSNYLVSCSKADKEPADFALLPLFIEYCNS